MTDISQILDYIKATALQLLPGCKIILFGSRARKEIIAAIMIFL